MSSEARYAASMVLAGVGDCLAYNNGEWEFNQNGHVIHQELESLGGIENLSGSKALSGRIVSDDTVMLLATARGLSKFCDLRKTKQPSEEMYKLIGKEYVDCLGDMHNRAPGYTCISGIHQMRLDETKGFRIPYNVKGGGCGGAMRSMCIGLLYPYEKDLDNLIAVSVESGRMSHHYPVGYLGSLASAFLVHCALNDYPINTWGHRLIGLEDRVKNYIQKEGYEVQPNLRDWDYFWNKWRDYLKLRKIDSGNSDAIPYYDEKFPNSVVFRDEEFRTWSFSGWAGSSGHDAPMIAYDACLYAGNDWKKLTDVAFFHGGDSDSTGVIAGAIYGALYGFDKVPEINYKGLEYLEELQTLASDLHTFKNLD